MLLALRRQRGAVLGWGASWLLLVGVYVASWPTVRENGEKYDDILADLPAGMKGLLGNGDQAGAFSTAEGYFTAELLALTGPLLVVTMGLLLGTRAAAHDEESGVLELLLAQPMTRVRLLLEQWGAASVDVLLVLTVAGLGLLGFGATVDLGLTPAQVARAVLVLAMLSLQALCLGLLLGAWLGRVGRARAWGGAVVLIAFLLHAVGPSVPGLGWGDAVSPFGIAVSCDPFRVGLGPQTLLSLMLPSLVMVTVACAVFRRRDLRLG